MKQVTRNYASASGAIPVLAQVFRFGPSGYVRRIGKRRGYKEEEGIEWPASCSQWRAEKCMDEQRKNVEERDQDTQMASAHMQERREARYEVPIEVEISGLTRDGQVFHERTFTRDVSEWGCGFIASVELKVDDIIAVSVISPGAEEPATRPTSLFQVVRVTREADGWLVGAWKMNREKMWGPYLEKLPEQAPASTELPEEANPARGDRLERDRER